MNRIEIIHNPFIVDTKFIINGHEPAANAVLSGYKESRLQVWIDKFFDDLVKQFNGKASFDIVFTGVEADYLDLKAAAESAKVRIVGMDYSLIWNEATPGETRLEELNRLVAHARDLPFVDTYLKDRPEVEKTLKEALDPDFDVYVVATMSAGKSTFINALLHRDLLPVANEATTATIMRIADSKDTADRFLAQRVGADGQIYESDNDVTSTTLREWNALEDTFQVNIEGNIPSISNRPDVRLIVTDTPGPNNSQDAEHQRRTLACLQDRRRNPLILYILNATQLGTDDDRKLLEIVAKTMAEGGRQSKDRFIFAVNKMDQIDPERGESIPAVLQRVRNYLESNGIVNPRVYPVSAEQARLCRKPGVSQTSKETRRLADLKAGLEEDSSLNLNQYMPVTPRVVRALKEKGLESVELASGIPTVEAMIDEYVEKYSFPFRVKRAYDALISVIEAGINEAQLEKHLRESEDAFVKLTREVWILKEKRIKGGGARTYKERLGGPDGKLLSPETIDRLTKIEQDYQKFLDDVGKEFEGKVPTIADAQKKIDPLMKKARFKFSEVLNGYELASEESRENVTRDLKAAYKQYVADLFDISDSVDFSAMENLKNLITDVNYTWSPPKVTQDVKVRLEKVWSPGVLPWNWFNTKTETIRETEDVVDLRNYWIDEYKKVKGEFLRLSQAAKKHITDEKDQMVDRFLDFMKHDFDTRFDDLIKTLEEKVENKENVQQIISDIREQYYALAELKRSLDEIIKV